MIRSFLFLLSLMCAAVASAQVNWQAVATEYAPLVMLHPSESAFPLSVERFRETAEVMSQDLQRYGSATEDLSQFPEDSILVNLSFQNASLNPQISAPSFVYIKDEPELDFVDVQYYFFYGYVGPAFLQVSYEYWGTERLRNVPIENLGTHTGDWEHVTVRFDREGVFQKMFLSQNRAGQWVTKDELTWEDNHPVVYSALHTHANYAYPGIKKVATLDLWPGVPYLTRVNSVNLVDVVHTDADLLQYDWMPKRDTTLSWRTWNNASGLQFVTGEEDWLGYKGQWGLQWDTGTLGAPPEIDSIPAESVRWIALLTQWYLLDKGFIRDEGDVTPSLDFDWAPIQ